MALITNNIKRYVRNFSWLVLANLATMGASFVLIILVARQLGQEQLGVYSSIMSLVFIFAYVADFGTSSVITRELSRDKQSVSVYIRYSFGLSVVLALAAFGLTLFTGWLLGKTGDVLILLVMASFWMVSDSLPDVFVSAFRAFENMHLITVMNLISKIVLVGGVGLLALGIWGFSLKGVFWVYVLSGLIGLFAAGYMAYRKFGRFRLSFSPLFTRNILKQSYFIGLSGLCFAVYNRVDVLMLSTMQSDTAAGIYSACYGLFLLVSIIPSLATSAVFPAFSRHYVTSRGKLRQDCVKGVQILLLLAVVIVTAIYLLGGWLLGFLYGGGYDAAVPALRILMLSIVFTFPASILSTLLIISGKQGWYFVASLLMVIVNVVLNLILIPAHSYMGASIAMLATGAFNLAVLYIIVKKSIQWDEKAVA